MKNPKKHGEDEEGPQSPTPSMPDLKIKIKTEKLEPVKCARQASSTCSGRLCQICSDQASGFHYGVWSCEGCKAFFKRSIQGTTDYVCPATNTCTIDKHRRKSCQACRLRKCMEMGMSKTASKNKRERKGSVESTPPKKLKEEPVEDPGAESTDTKKQTDTGHSPREASPAQTPDSPSPPNPASSQVIGLQQHNTIDPESCLNTNIRMEHTIQPQSPTLPTRVSTMPNHNQMPLSNGSFNPCISPPVSPLVYPKPVPPQPQSYPLLEILHNIDPAPLITNHDYTIPDSEMHLMTSIMTLADRELVDMIRWAKMIPGYIDLTLNDQVHLLESCWLEILIVGLSWRSKAVRAQALVFASDFQMTMEQITIAGMEEIGKFLFAIAEKFCEYDVKKEEYMLMKTMCLLNAEIKNLASRDKIVVLQNEIVEILKAVVETLHPDQPTRLGKLLMLMPHIRSTSLQSLAHLFDLKHEDSVPMCQLLYEMMDGHTVTKRHTNVPDGKVTDEFKTC